MPSQTVYVPEEAYEYAERTKADNQSIGQRLQELMLRGVEEEGVADTHE